VVSSQCSVVDFFDSNPKRIKYDRRIPTYEQQSSRAFANHQPTIDMSLNIEISNNSDPHPPGTVTIKLSGSLDTSTAPELERQMGLVLAKPVNDLVFDLADLKFVSSAGLRIFQVARKQMVARGGGHASFVNMQPQVQEVFAIIQSLPGIGVFKDPEALDRYLATRPRPNYWPGTEKK
jgi:anti-sigma B factor antagonist